MLSFSNLYILQDSFYVIFLFLGDEEILLLKQRLDQTERTMERIVEQIGAVTSKLQPLILAQAILAQQVFIYFLNEATKKSFICFIFLSCSRNHME